MRFAIDKFVQANNAITVTGWREPIEMQPVLRLRGSSIPTLFSSVSRADLQDVFGGDAESWGFELTSAVGPGSVDPTDVCVDLAPNLSVALSGVQREARIDDMRNRFLQEVSSASTLLEIGSRARSGNSHRDLFPPDCNYIGLDISSGPNVDVIGDAHDLRSAIKSEIDFIFSVSTFEHLLMPWVAALEMAHVMKLGGSAFIQSHQAWPVHEEPWDFWRFSDNAWRGLFNAHTGFEVVDAGYQYPASITSLEHASPSVQGLERQPAWLLSACLIRKISEPKVQWDAKVSDVYNLGYDHGAR